MKFTVEYKGGPTLDQCYFVASEGDNKVAIRATRLLDPKLHTIANDDTDKDNPKAPVQPEQIVEELQKADNLEGFKQMAYNMALKNEKLSVTAAEDKPIFALEEPKEIKIKTEDDPIVSAEKQHSAENVPMESDAEVSKYYSQLSKKAPGAPEMAIDLQSKVVALESQVKTLSAEVETKEVEKKDLQVKLDDKMKEGESDKVLELLSDIGLIEDAKDKETYKKKLAGVPEQALGVLETIFKDIAELMGGDVAKKPPTAPKAPIKDGKAPAPVFSSADNVLHASIQDNDPYGDRLTAISRAWIDEDDSKIINA